MYRFIVVGVVGLSAIVIVGILLTMLQKNRANQDLLYSVNNFRELGQFSELYLSADGKPRPPADPRWALGPDPKFAPQPVPELEKLGIVAAIPAGTAGRMDLPPSERLSWVFTLMPTFNQKRQATAELYGTVRTTEPWNSGSNRPIAETRLQVVSSFAKPLNTPAGEPGPAQIVGLSGLGTDSATLALTGPTPLPGQAPGAIPLIAPPRAGCFRYDAVTPFPAITDGLSQTILFGDVSENLGPWLQGGPSTVRGLDDGPNAARPIGSGGQFGGNHREGALFGFADHSVRIFTDRTDALILAGLVTINGGAGQSLPGE